MVAAARWIAKHAIPPSVKQSNNFLITKIKHSDIYSRENEKFSTCTCIAFGPGICLHDMELAESGKEFITTLVNKNDLVPSFSKFCENLRFQVMASSWLSDLREQIKRTRFLNIVNSYVCFMRSHLPFPSNPRSKVVDADMLRALSSGSEPATNRSGDATRSTNGHSTLSCWSCIGARRRAVSSARKP
uniref:Uncharacterized protein n=1 Tax=Ananas comosus var. bracteatus TaxID=296719 RepID=A0A6V7NF24_ANACO|nr:unnamed protein product [Ananas comosus var. bracteatus]